MLRPGHQARTAAQTETLARRPVVILFEARCVPPDVAESGARRAVARTRLGNLGLAVGVQRVVHRRSQHKLLVIVRRRQLKAGGSARQGHPPRGGASGWEGHPGPCRQYSRMPTAVVAVRSHDRRSRPLNIAILSHCRHHPRRETFQPPSLLMSGGSSWGVLASGLGSTRRIQPRRYRAGPDADSRTRTPASRPPSSQVRPSCGCWMSMRTAAF